MSDIIVTELNEFSPDSVPEVSENMYKKLCQIAKMDAWHDHHTIKGINENKIEEFVKRHLPDIPDMDCYKGMTVVSAPTGTESAKKNKKITPGSPFGDGRPINEDMFIYRFLLTELKRDDESSQDACKPNINTGFQVNYGEVGYNGEKIYDDKMVLDRYQVGHVPFFSTSGDDDDDDDDEEGGDPSPKRSGATISPEQENTSQVQRFFEDIGLSENIFIIRDVAYGNWADDIKKWGKGNYSGKETNIITVQSAAGIFDPGPSTNPFTKAGKRQGFQDVQSKSRYAIFDTQNSQETKILYPKVIDIPDDQEDIISRNQLLYTRYNCTLYARANKQPSETTIPKENVKSFIESASVNFMVSVDDAESTSNRVYINSVTSSSKDSKKAKNMLELAKDDINETLTSTIKSKFDERIFKEEDSYDEYVSNSGKLKIMTKKFGDHGQAVTACRNNLNYLLFEPINIGDGSVENTPDNFTISKGISNSVHAFLSFDRVAVASAVYYGCPIVIYNNHNGAVIFVSKKLISVYTTPEKKAIMAVNNYNSKMKSGEQLIRESQIGSEEYKDFDAMSNELMEQIESDLITIKNFITFIYNYLNTTEINQKEASSLDIAYQTLFVILTNIHISIKTARSFNGTYHNVSTIKEEIESIDEQLKEDDKKLIKDSSYNTTRLELFQTASTKLRECNDKLSSNITNLFIIQSTSDSLRNIVDQIKIADTKRNDFKKISSLKSSLKLSKINSYLINNLNPYVGTQKKDRRKIYQAGTIYVNFGFSILEDIYSSMGEEEINGLTVKNVFSSILKRVRMEVNPECSNFFLSSIGRNSETLPPIQIRGLETQLSKNKTKLTTEKNKEKKKLLNASIKALNSQLEIAKGSNIIYEQSTNLLEADTFDDIMEIDPPKPEPLTRKRSSKELPPSPESPSKKRGGKKTRKYRKGKTLKRKPNKKTKKKRGGNDILVSNRFQNQPANTETEEQLEQQDKILKNIDELTNNLPQEEKQNIENRLRNDYNLSTMKDILTELQKSKETEQQQMTTEKEPEEISAELKLNDHYDVFLNIINFAININGTQIDKRLILSKKEEIRTKHKKKLILKTMNLNQILFVLETVKTILTNKVGSEKQTGGGKQRLDALIKSISVVGRFQGRAKSYIDGYLKTKFDTNFDTMKIDLLEYAELSDKGRVFVEKNEDGTYKIIGLYDLDINAFAYLLYILKNGGKTIKPDEFKSLKLTLLNNANYFNEMITTTRRTIPEYNKSNKEEYKNILKEHDKIDSFSEYDNNYPDFDPLVIMETMVTNIGLLATFTDFLTEEYEMLQEPSYDVITARTRQSKILEQIKSNIERVNKNLEDNSPEDYTVTLEDLENANLIETLEIL